MSEDMHQCAIPAAAIPSNASIPIARKLFLRFCMNDISDLSRDAISLCLGSVMLSVRQYSERVDF